MQRPDIHPDDIHTIDDVLTALDRVVDWSLDEPSRLGYFAALYRKVTQKVKDGIARGDFEDGPRMERLDVVFARRYLVALDRFLRGERATEPWQVALDAAGEWRPLILQQLLAGINAHINLDLGIAAAEVAPGDRLPALKHDFDRINAILFSLVREVEDAISSVSPWIAVLRYIGGKAGDELIRFSLQLARDGSWELATRLAPRPRDQWTETIERRERTSARVGREVLSPGPFLRWGLLVIRMRESSDVRQSIEVLAATPMPTDDAVARNLVSLQRAG
jgi:hypothetical protein